MNKNLITFLIRIKNISLSKKKAAIKFKPSQMLINYASFLYREGIIQAFYVAKRARKKSALIVKIRHFENNAQANNIRLLSVPSRIKSLTHFQIARAHLKQKTIVLSTPKGLMSHTDCLKKNLGGTAIFSC